MKYQELNEQRIKAFNELKVIDNALDLLKGKGHDLNVLEELSMDLNLKINIFREEMDKIQEKCEHDWVPDGNGSHKSYERCTKCDQLRSV